MRIGIWTALILVAASLGLAPAENGPATPGASTNADPASAALPASNAVSGDFVHIRLILETRCLRCHSEGKTESHLDLSTRDLMLKGGDVDGAAIVPGHPEKSPLYQQMMHAEDPGMPKDESKLSDDILDEFRQWITAGAPMEGKLKTGPVVTSRTSDLAMFHPVVRPAVPAVKNVAWVRNPIDAFIASQQEAHGLKPRPEASKRILLRRVYIDLIGLPPTPDEIRAFEADSSPDAYDKVVDRLLADPRYGERWGRHWLDIWRYSDAYQIGFSSFWGGVHAWRWRDWVVENLNKDTGYDQMVLLMIAGDEVAPTDTDALCATGFMVRNVSSDHPEQQQAMVEHVGKAFLGITMNCCRCHDHKFDPFSQKEYYGFCSIFAPSSQHPDPIPGKADVKKDSIDRIYDSKPDELATLNGEAIAPCVPAVLGGGKLDIQPIKIPLTSVKPMRRPYAIQDALDASTKAIETARQAMESPAPEQACLTKLRYDAAVADDAALRAVLKVEELEDAGKTKDSPDWVTAATAANQAQRESAVATALADVEKERVAVAKLQAAHPGMTLAPSTGPAAGTTRPAGGTTRPANNGAEKNLADAAQRLDSTQKVLAKAQAESKAPPDTKFKPRDNIATYPAESSGRRLALTSIIDKQNPLTARVAVNDMWLRHFGAALQANVTDFGHRAMPITNPDLLNWLAAEFMDDNWSTKKIHRLIVTSATYREDSEDDESDANIDLENKYLWRMNPQRMEAEVVRDSVLYMSNKLEPGSPGQNLKVDNKIVDENRRSLYYPLSQNAIMPFLATFDGPDVNACYERESNVTPQQALIMANSKFIYDQSQLVAQRLTATVGADATQDNNAKFVDSAFDLILNEVPTADEKSLCAKYLIDRAAYLTAGKGATVPGGHKNPTPPAVRAREDLVHVLFSHNDFLTVR